MSVLTKDEKAYFAGAARDAKPAWGPMTKEQEDVVHSIQRTPEGFVVKVKSKKQVGFDGRFIELIASGHALTIRGAVDTAIKNSKQITEGWRVPLQSERRK